MAELVLFIFQECLVLCKNNSLIQLFAQIPLQPRVRSDAKVSRASLQRLSSRCFDHADARSGILLKGDPPRPLHWTRSKMHSHSCSPSLLFRSDPVSAGACLDCSSHPTSRKGSLTLQTTRGEAVRHNSWRYSLFGFQCWNPRVIMASLYGAL
jgi:hypothetical protein